MRFFKMKEETTTEYLKRSLENFKQLNKTQKRKDTQTNFKTLKGFYNFITSSPFEVTKDKQNKYIFDTITTQEYQQIYKQLSDNNQTKLKQKGLKNRNKYLCWNNSTTAKIENKSNYVFNSKVNRQLENIRQQKENQRKAIKKLFVRENLQDDLFLYWSFVGFLENNQLRTKGKQYKNLLLSFIRAYDYKNQTINENKLNSLFINCVCKCSDFLAKYYDGEYKTIARDKHKAIFEKSF